MLSNEYQKKGFSLIELVVIVSLITTVSVTGLGMFQSTRGKAQEAKYRGDVAAIKKAFEKNYDPSLNNGQGGYKALSIADFADGKIPTDKDGNYYIVTAKANNVITSYAACINPQTGIACLGPNSATCSCAVSTQGAGAQVSNITNSSCDPYGILGNGLVGYWKFDDGKESNTAADSSGNNNNGPWYGSGLAEGFHYWSVQNGGGLFGWGGAKFNGMDNYVNAGNSSSLNLGNGSFAISFWVRPAFYDQETVILAKRENSGNYAQYTIGITSGDSYWSGGSTGKKLTFLFRQNESNTRGGYTTSDVFDNLWHHIVIVGNHSNNSITVYVDGLSKAITMQISNGAWPNLDSFSDLNIGVDTGNSHYYNGLIDDLRLYNRALSNIEVGVLYNNANSCIP